MENRRKSTRYRRSERDLAVDSSDQPTQIGAAAKVGASDGTLAQTADRLERAQQIARIGNWEWDAATGRQWWSDEIYRLIGREPRSVNPEDSVMFHAMHEADRERVRRIYEESVKGAHGYYVRYRVVLPDGAERVFQETAECYFSADGKLAGQRGTTQDVTAQFRTELELTETARRLEAALRLAHLGTWEWEPEHDTLLLSEEAARICGLGDDAIEIPSVQMLKMIHPEDRDLADALTIRTRETGKPYNLEYRLVCPDGTVRTVIEHAERFTDGISGRSRVCGTMQDITERKRTEEALATLNLELEQRVEERTDELRVAQAELIKNERLATLGRLTATVSHELRNPLGVIRASIYVLERAIGNRTEKVAGAIERINRNIARCDEIIRELLEYTRAPEPRLRATVIDAWLKDILEEQPVPEGIRVKRKFGAPGLEVLVDPDRLRRAVINIYENACQALAAPRHGDVINRQPQISIETRLRGDRLEIIFTDNGHGVPDELLDKVFEPLFSTKTFGVGLGLPTVHQIMRQHGGGVTVSRRRGGGARFLLWLPFGRQEGTAEC